MHVPYRCCGDKSPVLTLASSTCLAAQGSCLLAGRWWVFPVSWKFFPNSHTMGDSGDCPQRCSGFTFFLCLGLTAFAAQTKMETVPAPAKPFMLKQTLPVPAAWGSLRTPDPLGLRQTMPLALLWPLLGSQAGCSVILSSGCIC